jgi:uncharacterized protein
VTPPPLVEIRYRRPPDRLEVFHQPLVHDGPDVKVTFLEAVQRKEPASIGDRVVLEPGSPIVWFTFPGAWHDIARFHLADGTFTGIYANILTPVLLGDDQVWDTTDLYLDLWLDDEGLVVLDEDELAAALEDGTIELPLATAARAEVVRVLAEAAAGRWPPSVVHEWTLERARERMKS